MSTFTNADVITIHEAMDAVNDLMGYGAGEWAEDLMIQLHELSTRISEAASTPQEN